MAKISKQDIDYIFENIDIVSLVSEYIKLEKRGQNYLGLCPFHNEKTPSFTVSPDKKIAHCFGCGKGGNIFQFVSLIENITYNQAIVKLGTRLGLNLESNDNKEISFDKNSYIITDIFNIDINNKKVLSKIYSSLLKEIVEDISSYNELSTNIRVYFEKLIFNSSLEIEQGEEIDMSSLLKLGDFKIHVENDDILEKFVKFLKVLTELCGYKIIFVVGLHTVFTQEEIIDIYKEVCLNKINIINIEYQQFNNLSNENYKEIVYIFDEDNCEI